MSLSRLIAYAAPGFALAMPTIPAYVFLPTVYGAAIGLNAAGLALLLSRTLDVIIDPIVGELSDRLQTPWGRRKPWIAVGAVIGGFALIKLFQPPEAVGFTYLLLWSFLLYLGWTLVTIPYTAWAAELTTDYHQRVRITAAREGTMLLGIVAAGSIPAAATATGHTEPEALVAIAWLACLIGLPAFVALLWLVPDPRPQATLKAKTSAPIRTMLEQLRTLRDCRPFLRLLTAWFANGLANGIPSVLFLLYLEYGLRASQAARSGLILVYFVAAVGAIPIWTFFSARLGKHRTWCWAMIGTCAAFAWAPFLEPGQIPAFTLICIVTGMGLGADLILPPAMQADVVDYDTLRNGHSRAGLFFALWGMSTKLAMALAVGLAFPALTAFGFKIGQVNADQSVLALTVIYAWIPVALKGVAISFVWTFPITASRQRIIRRRLDARARRIHPTTECD